MTKRRQVVGLVVSLAVVFAAAGVASHFTGRSAGREIVPRPDLRPAGIVDNFLEEVLGVIFGRFLGTHRPWR